MDEYCLMCAYYGIKNCVCNNEDSIHFEEEVDPEYDCCDEFKDKFKSNSEED